MTFRKYGGNLPASVVPLAEGKNATEIRKRMTGTVRVIAHGPMREDGTCTVSLHDETTGRYYQEAMTKVELTEAYRRDGVEPIWVNYDFEFGEEVKV